MSRPTYPWGRGWIVQPITIDRYPPGTCRRQPCERRPGPPPWEGDLPLEELASAGFPKLVVSGGPSVGFEAICDELGRRIDALRAVVEGTGHEIQFTGPPVNDLLLDRWRS